MTLIYLISGEQVCSVGMAESQISHPCGGRHHVRDGEPDKAGQNETPDSLCCYGRRRQEGFEVRKRVVVVGEGGMFSEPIDTLNLFFFPRN